MAWQHEFDNRHCSYAIRLGLTHFVRKTRILVGFVRRFVLRQSPNVDYDLNARRANLE